MQLLNILQSLVWGAQLIVGLKTMQMEGQSPFHHDGTDRDEDSKLLF